MTPSDLEHIRRIIREEIRAALHADDKPLSLADEVGAVLAAQGVEGLKRFTRARMQTGSLSAAGLISPLDSVAIVRRGKR